jgi:hypothetical protein
MRDILSNGKTEPTQSLSLESQTCVGLTIQVKQFCNIEFDLFKLLTLLFTKKNAKYEFPIQIFLLIIDKSHKINQD